jgi:archaellin
MSVFFLQLSNTCSYGNEGAPRYVFANFKRLFLVVSDLKNYRMSPRSSKIEEEIAVDIFETIDEYTKKHYVVVILGDPDTSLIRNKKYIFAHQLQNITEQIIDDLNQRFSRGEQYHYQEYKKP